MNRDTQNSTGSFYDEDGTVHLRVSNLAESPPEFVKRRKKKNPAGFTSVSPRPNKEVKSPKPSAPDHTLGEGRITLIDKLD